MQNLVITHAKSRHSTPTVTVFIRAPESLNISKLLKTHPVCVPVNFLQQNIKPKNKHSQQKHDKNTSRLKCKGNNYWMPALSKIDLERTNVIIF